MKKLILLITIICLFSVLGVYSKEPAKDGVFVHISHGTDNPHRLLMALNMAAVMAVDKDVLVYFDIEAVRAVLKDSPDIKFSHFPSSKTQLEKLIKKNATLMACSGCLKAIGKSEEDLAEGIQLADKVKFFSFTKGRILTLDY